MFARDRIIAGEFEDEHGMGTGGAFVGFRCGDRAVSRGSFEELLDSVGGVEIDARQVCNRCFPSCGIVFDLMFLFVHFFRFTKEIVDVFIVNLKEGSFHGVCPSLGLKRFGDGVDLVDCTRDHAVAGGGHSICFP